MSGHAVTRVTNLNFRQLPSGRHGLDEFVLMGSHADGIEWPTYTFSG